MMARGLVRLAGATAALFAFMVTLGSPLVPLSAHITAHSDDALETACGATLSDADLCPCAITAAREAGVSDAALAAIFTDEAAAQTADRVQYNRFRRAKIQCAKDAAMAALMGRDAIGAQIGVQPDGTYTGRPTGPKPLPSDSYIGQAPTRTLLAHLAKVGRQEPDDAGCTVDLFIVPLATALPSTASQLAQFARSKEAFQFASAVPSPVMDQPGYLMNFRGRNIVLSPATYSLNANGPEQYVNGETRLTLRRGDGPITDGPAATFTQMRVTLADETASETFDALELVAC